MERTRRKDGHFLSRVSRRTQIASSTQLPSDPTRHQRPRSLESLLCQISIAFISPPPYPSIYRGAPLGVVCYIAAIRWREDFAFYWFLPFLSSANILFASSARTRCVYGRRHCDVVRETRAVLIRSSAKSSPSLPFYGDSFPPSAASLNLAPFVSVPYHRLSFPGCT